MDINGTPNGAEAGASAPFNFQVEKAVTMGDIVDSIAPAAPEADAAKPEAEAPKADAQAETKTGEEAEAETPEDKPEDKTEDEEEKPEGEESDPETPETVTVDGQEYNVAELVQAQAALAELDDALGLEVLAADAEKLGVAPFTREQVVNHGRTYAAAMLQMTTPEGCREVIEAFEDVYAELFVKESLNAPAARISSIDPEDLDDTGKVLWNMVGRLSQKLQETRKAAAVSVEKQRETEIAAQTEAKMELHVKALKKVLPQGMDMSAAKIKEAMKATGIKDPEKAVKAHFYDEIVKAAGAGTRTAKPEGDKAKKPGLPSASESRFVDTTGLGFAETKALIENGLQHQKGARKPTAEDYQKR